MRSSVPKAIMWREDHNVSLDQGIKFALSSRSKDIVGTNLFDLDTFGCVVKMQHPDTSCELSPSTCHRQNDSTTDTPKVLLLYVLTACLGLGMKSIAIPGNGSCAA
eukprot:1916799-Amphidinium_carterae.1